jgi:hypothetical protein
VSLSVHDRALKGFIAVCMHGKNASGGKQFAEPPSSYSWPTQEVDSAEFYRFRLMEVMKAVYQNFGTEMMPDQKGHH